MTTRLETESDLGEDIHILGNLPFPAYIRPIPDQLEDLEKRRYSSLSAGRPRLHGAIPGYLPSALERDIRPF